MSLPPRLCRSDPDTRSVQRRSGPTHQRRRTRGRSGGRYVLPCGCLNFVQSTGWKAASA